MTLPERPQAVFAMQKCQEVLLTFLLKESRLEHGMYHNAKRGGHAVAVEEDAISCCLCGTHIYQSTAYDKSILNPAIRQAYGSAARVQVSLTMGEDDSYIHAGETYSYDICPKCFEDKLKSWLDEQGAKEKVELWSS